MPSFQPFSSGRQSSHLNTPETTPLRKRENDSFASPEAPLLWRQSLQPATGGLDSTSSYYSPSLAASSSNFAELNFLHTTRRHGGRRHGRHKHGAQFWIPWLMKGILASPLLVVLLWFVVVAVRHPHEATDMKTNRYGASATNSRNLRNNPFRPFLSAQQRHAHNPDNGKKLLPVYVPLGASQNDETQQDFPLPPHDQFQAQQQFMIPQLDAYNALANIPLGFNGQQQEHSQLSLDQPQALLPPLQEQGAYMIVGQNMMQLTQQRPGQLYQYAQQPQLQAQPQLVTQGQMQVQQILPLIVPQGQTQLTQPQLHMQQARPQLLMQEEAPIIELHQRQEGNPHVMMYRGTHLQNQRPVHPSKRGNVRGALTSVKTSKHQDLIRQPKVYYYDPAHVMVQGRLRTPTVVYDEHGNVVELASLVTGTTELYMEPPQLTNMPPFGASRYSNSTSSNSTGPLGPLLPPPPLEMKIKTPESWGQSTAQDQSIIVCTVAVMALLVGALSARRLRARSFLSSCIENESLEDEAAFDSAYTINGGDSYNTFGWKGDLEKFDV